MDFDFLLFKKPPVLILLIPALAGCQIYTESSEPVLYMGGGKWTFIDYEIVIVSSISPAIIVENDTICIDSFSEFTEAQDGIILKQHYSQTSISRRFIKNMTQWEFDGFNLYCDWIYTPGGMVPSHEPFWVTYPDFFYTDQPVMSVMDTYTGTKTDFTFMTNNTGIAPPDKLVMTSPNIVINLYSSGGARDKAVTLKVVLMFMR